MGMGGNWNVESHSRTSLVLADRTVDAKGTSFVVVP